MKNTQQGQVFKRKIFVNILTTILYALILLGMLFVSPSFMGCLLLCPLVGWLSLERTTSMVWSGIVIITLILIRNTYYPDVEFINLEAVLIFISGSCIFFFCGASIVILVSFISSFFNERKN